MKIPTSVLNGISINGIELMVLIEDITMGMMQIIFGIMEIVSINMVQIEFIVQLGAVETNAAAGLDTLRIVIRLTRGVENS